MSCDCINVTIRDDKIILRPEEEEIILRMSAEGPKGDPGESIVSIEKTATDGLVDTWTITTTDGATYNFQITNGAQGETGPAGANGNGSAYIDEDENQLVLVDGASDGYYTESEVDTLLAAKLSDAPTDDSYYVRRNGTWVSLATLDTEAF